MATAEFAIREATRDDAAQIADLMTTLGYPTTPGEMGERLSTIGRDSNHRTLVAHLDVTVVGLAGVGVAPFYERNGTYGRLLALVVDERYRGAGIGQRLVEAAEGWLRSRGATTIVVNSGHHRDGAHRFYERLGYSSTGIRFVKELTSASR
jgi:GNAT superfamily N-acetyltransferase